MEVTGLDVPAYVPSQQLRAFFVTYLRNINIEVDDLEVVDVYSSTRKNRNVNQPVLIVSFLNEAVKNRIVRNKICIDKANSQRSITVYFGNVLTKSNHQLLLNARRAMKEKKIERAWSMNGEIFILRSQQEGKIQLINNDHLHHLIINSIPPITPENVSPQQTCTNSNNMDMSSASAGTSQSFSSVLANGSGAPQLTNNTTQ